MQATTRRAAGAELNVAIGLARLGFRVGCYTPDVLTETVADTIFALMLATARRLIELVEFVKAGHWKHSIDETLYGVEHRC